MYPWLLAVTGSARTASWGAIAYMAAPYHLLDHYTRGAFAEFTGYVVLPVLFLAIWRIAEGRRAAIVLLAVAYAALLLSHLPTALLISIAALPPYVFFRAWRLPGNGALGFLARCLAGGILGLGLAAIYVLPASSLQGAISADQLWTPAYSPETWFLLRPERWIRPLYTILIVAAISAACCIAGLCCLLALRAARPGRAEGVFWAGLCLLEMILMSGLVPWFWTWVPLVSKVQFPWRLLVVVEFATITALCCVAWRGVGRVVLLGFGAAIVVLCMGLTGMGFDIKERMRITWIGEPTPPPQDVKEYLPAGYPIEPNAGYGRLSLGQLRDLPLVACHPVASVCTATPLAFGGVAIDVQAETAVDVVVRRFFFPAWRLDPARPLAPTADFRLIRFTAEPGRHAYRLEPGALPVERWSWAISGASLFLLLIAAVFAARDRPRRAGG
jgi:hypothetical protein